jgi:hypothetical protein
MIFFQAIYINIGMANKMMNMDFEYDCYEDELNMDQHLQDFHTSLKMGNPEDALRALQALNASGVRVQSQASSVVETHNGCGPKPRFAKFVPAEKSVIKPACVEADVVEKPTAKPAAKSVVVEEPAVDEPAVDEPAVGDAPAINQTEMTAAPAVKQERALRKKLERCKALCDTDGVPLASLNADQTSLVRSIRTIEKDLEALEKKNAALAARTAKRDTERARRRAEEEEINKQLALIGEITPAAGKSSSKTSSKKSKRTVQVKKVTVQCMNDEVDTDDYDTISDDPDSDDESLLLQLGPRIVTGGSYAQKGVARETSRSIVHAEPAKTTSEKTTRGDMQYAHHGLSGVVTRWNGKNGHIETFDIMVRGQSRATRVFVDGRWLKSPLAVGETVRFDTLNGHYGLNAANCVVHR